MNGLLGGSRQAGQTSNLPILASVRILAYGFAWLSPSYLFKSW
jgi:hypothetical protein